jgi:hypothetical protein
MYKGISRFLNHLKTEVANFSNFLRVRTRRQIGVRERRSSPPGWYERLTTTAGRERAVPAPTLIEEDLPPAIPFEKDHRIALWIGESDHAGRAFVRENSSVILALPDARRMTCGEIAKQLNGTNSTKPRSGQWTDALVYHFTRHYMSVRPVFYPEDKPAAGLPQIPARHLKLPD